MWHIGEDWRLAGKMGKIQWYYCNHTDGLGMQTVPMGICWVAIGASAGSMIAGSQCIGLNGVHLSVIGMGSGSLVSCCRCCRCTPRIGEDQRLAGKVGKIW